MKNDKNLNLIGELKTQLNTPKTETKIILNDWQAEQAEVKTSKLSAAARSKVVNRSGDSYVSERTADLVPSYGPCSSCPSDSVNRNRNFRLKVVLEGRLFGAASLFSGGHTEWFYNTNDAAVAARKIVNKQNPWTGMQVTGGNRTRTASAIWDAIRRHNAGYDINGETASSFSDS